MPLKDNIEHHWNEIARKRETVVEALSWSATGRNLQRQSGELSESDVMKQLINALASSDANPIDRFKMAQYLAMAMENEPVANLGKFAAYLDMIAGKSNSQRRAGYYRNLRKYVSQLANSPELSNYMNVYNEFMEDDGREAVLARNIMDEISATTQKIMGEYS